MKRDLLATTGQGPKECLLALEGILARMKNEAKTHNIEMNILDEQGLSRSSIISLEGENIQDFCGSWIGAILWKTQSPIRPNHKRKNWFVQIIEIKRPSAQWNLEEKDVRFETFRAGGPGGQHQNTTDSAVRAVHLPTGLYSVSRSERSQHRNKASAIRQLENLFLARAIEAQSRTKTVLHHQHSQIERGDPIRTFKGAKFVEEI